ncbi:MAG TPA: LLM class F420-dependent oxidoreductase [Candidatus Methylomirabilis sp.]|nr:LLM class F420-dependent oxidoreductase [Candidatus Methylomirabilis sp.]
MRFGFPIPTRGALGTLDAIRRLGRAADDLQYDSVWITDHVVIPKAITSRYPYSPDGRLDLEAAQHYLDPLTVMSYLAGVTERATIGSSVLILPYRNPVLVAKMVATLDVLSRGRVILAVGVGWMREEFEALNLTTFAERGAATDEYIRILRELWTKEWPSYRGRFYSFDEVRFYPKPVQKPHPPVWIGGHTKAAIRRAALLGDGWHPIGLRPPAGLYPEEYAKAAADLRAQAEAAGRDPKAITLSFRAPITFTDVGTSGARIPFIGSRDQIVEDIHTYQRLGVSHLIFDFAGTSVEAILEQLQRFAEEVRPALRGRP